MEKKNNFEVLRALLERRDYHALQAILAEENEVDIAEFMEELTSEQATVVFRTLPKELAAETFVEMEPEAQELLIRGFSDSELKEVVDELYLDDAVDLV